MLLRRILKLFGSLLLCLLMTAVHATDATMATLILSPAPGNLDVIEGLWESKSFTTRVNDLPVFVYGTDMNWSFFNFATDETTQVEVTYSGVIETYQVRPVSYGIEAIQHGNRLTFSLPASRHVVVQVNRTDKLLISSDPLEDNPITEASDGVIYFGPGVHHVGEGYSPEGLQPGDTIYIAGGAVVEGLFNIRDVPNLTIRGRGIVAMGEWPWTRPEDRSGMVLRPNCDGLYIEGITLVKSPGWQLSIGDSTATIERIKLLGVGNWYNSDGIQTWIDNRGTRIWDSFIFARDDALNINAGTHDYHASKLILWNDDNGASFMLGWGGEQDSSNITVEDSIVLENSSRHTGVFSARWGAAATHTVSNVVFRNIIIENATTFMDMLIAESDWNSGSAGRFEGIAFDHIQTPIINGIMLGNSDENSFNRVTFTDLYVDGELISSADAVDIFRRNVFGFAVNTS